MRRWMMFLWIFLMICPATEAQKQLPVEKNSGQKIDIVLVQDESGSMETTDPRGLRRMAADLLVDNLRLAGEGNNLGLILFGTVPQKSVDLSQEFEAIQKIARKGLEYRRFGESAYLSLETTPARDYTDIFGALEMAYEMLSQSPDDVTIQGESYSKQKLVLFLTDGKIDPWAGNLDRYGDIARDYLEYMQEIRPGERYKKGERYREKVADIDRERIEREIIDRFKKKGWRVYPVGFSDGVDRDLLENLAFRTYGNPGIAKDATELARILENVIPKAQNVIPLLVQGFCHTKSSAGTAVVGADIKAALFKVDFSRMIEQGAFIRPDHLLVILNAPGGEEIRSDREGMFTFNIDKHGRVLTVTYFKEYPASGKWHIQVQGIGKDICGKIDVAGRRNQIPQIRLDPELEQYWEDSEVEVTVSLLGEGGKKLPIRKVRGRVRTPEHEEMGLIFSDPNVNNEARARINLNKGLGEYFLIVTITDEKYGTQIHKDKVIRVIPIEFCDLIVTPKKIDLGVLGDTRLSTTLDEGITVETGTFPKSVDIKMKKPVLEKGITAIPIYWITVRPEQGTATPERPFRFNIEVNLPKEVPSGIKDGIYKGELTIESSCAKHPIEIQVELEIRFPEIIIKGSERLRKLHSSFWFRLCKPLGKTIQVGTSSLRDREVTLSLSPNIKDAEGHNQERIQMYFAHQPGQSSMEVLTRKGRFAEINIVTRLLETRLEPDLRVPPGTYTGELRARGALMREIRIPIEIEIPEKPFILTFRWIMAGICAIVLFIIACLSVSLGKLETRQVFEGRIDVRETPFTLTLGGKDLTFNQAGEDYTVISKSDGVYRLMVE